MAVSTNIVVTDAGTRFVSETYTRTPTGTNRVDEIVTVTQSGEFTYTFQTAIGNLEECVVHNKSANNFISLGFSTGVYPMKLLPGAIAVLPGLAAQASLFLLANTADCDAHIFAREL